MNARIEAFAGQPANASDSTNSRYSGQMTARQFDLLSAQTVVRVARLGVIRLSGVSRRETR